MSGNVGCFFWSHDMGGFMGDIENEIYARWMQFGAFSAGIRLHGMGADRRPWKWATWAQESIHKSFKLRSHLMPYTYSAVAQITKESVPLCRAMYLEYPDKLEAFQNPQQYLYGNHFLIAPITKPGNGPGLVSDQTVWFPEGTWYNWETGEGYEGECEVLVSATLNEIPAFVRGGVPIPTQPYTLRMTQAKLNELQLNCFPGPNGETGTFVLYEDDGISQDYERGCYRETRLTYHRKDDQVTISISPQHNQYDDGIKERQIILSLPCTEAAMNICVDSGEHTHHYDASSRTNTIEFDNVPIDASLTVSLTVPETDQDAIKHRQKNKRAKQLTGYSYDGSLKDALLSIEPDDMQSEVARLTGLGIVRKNESYRGDQEHYRTKLFAPSGLFENDHIKVRAIDDSGQVKHPLLDAEFHCIGTTPIQLPDFPEFDDEHVTYILEGTIEGQPCQIKTRAN
jgi:hypothetical protein